MKYGTLTLGQIEAVVNKLGGMNGVQRFLRGELVISEPRSWREENDTIYFTVTTNGMTGEEWIKHLEGKKYGIRDFTKRMLLSDDFQPTAPGVTIEIAVLKGKLFKDNARKISDISAEAERRQLAKPNAEIACLIRDQFTNEEIEAMGLLTIVVVHDPIKISIHKVLFEVRSCGCELDYNDDLPEYSWLHGDGFAFCVAQAT